MLNTPRDFMQTAERVIVQQFLTLPRARLIHTPYGNIVYVPPTRADSVLLVAHTDTVFGSQRIQLRQSGDVITSARDGVGIGADDRAGVAALWSLRKCGHALLLVPAEETGCQGSRWLVNHYHTGDILDHHYMVQFDRRGSSDLVRYSCDNEVFDDYLVANMGGYRLATGSFSDICELAPAGGVAAVNVSIGFNREHTARESLDLAAWWRTVQSVRAMIAQPCPRFEYIDAPVVYTWGYGGGAFRGGGDAFRGTLSLDKFTDNEDDDSPQDDYAYDNVCPDCDVELVEEQDCLFCPQCMATYETDDTFSEY